MPANSPSSSERCRWRKPKGPVRTVARQGALKKQPDRQPARSRSGLVFVSFMVTIQSKSLGRVMLVDCPKIRNEICGAMLFASSTGLLTAVLALILALSITRVWERAFSVAHIPWPFLSSGV